MGLRGIIRDILILYLGYRLIKIWIFGSEFTGGVGVITLLVMILTVMFIMERVASV